MANLSGYIFLALAILLGITSNGFLKSTNGVQMLTAHMEEKSDGALFLGFQHHPVCNPNSCQL